MRRVFAVVALVALGLSGCTQIRARDLIREGNTAYKDGQFELAIEKYSESLEHEPDGVTVLWNRACAAESLVLSLKDAANEAQQKARRDYTDMALADFQAWAEASEPLSEDDQKAVHDHRLALLKADERCDDLVAYWLDKHREAPKDESLYSIIARTHEDTCGKPDKADEWYVKRTEDFPESEKAWYTLAVRKFEPLFPDPESGLQFNDNVDPKKRLELADEVIDLLNKATSIKPKYRDPYVWRAMAYTQKQFARVYDELSDDPRDKLQALLAREDSMLAWREQKAVCDIDSIPDCAAPIDFAVASKTPGELGDKSVVVSGKVVEGSIKRDPASTDDKAIYTFEIAAEPEAPADPAAAGDGKKPPKKGEAPEVEPLPNVKARYVFELPPPPEPVEGEEAVEQSPEDRQAEIDAFKAEVTATVESWSKDKSFDFNGAFEGGVFVTGPAPTTACCPPAPIPEAEYAADLETRKEIEAQLAEQAAKEK